MNRAVVVTCALASLLCAAPVCAQESDWWDRDLLVDYGLIVVAFGSWGGLMLVEPAEEAAIGPVFDREHPEAILDPVHGPRLGRHHGSNTVSSAALQTYAGSGLVAVSLLEGIPHVNGHREFDGHLLHDASIGYLEALAVTVLVTEGAKVSVGRLRPDFQDRVRRYYCGNRIESAIRCDEFDGEAVREGAFVNGRVSFFSGHASVSFMTSTYVSLVLGGRFVWGDRASQLGTGGTVLGILAQGTLMTFAGFVASSRVDDGRHHLSDVVVGSIVGITAALAFYWRHFDTNGWPKGGEPSDRASPNETPLMFSWGAAF